MHQIIVKKNLMGIQMANAFARMVIMMIAQIIYVSNAIIAGKKNKIYYKLILVLIAKV